MSGLGWVPFTKRGVLDGEQVYPPPLPPSSPFMFLPGPSENAPGAAGVGSVAAEMVLLQLWGAGGDRAGDLELLFAFMGS